MLHVLGNACNWPRGTSGDLPRVERIVTLKKLLFLTLIISFLVSTWLVLWRAGKNSVFKREDGEGEGVAYRRGRQVKYRDGSLVD